MYNAHGDVTALITPSGEIKVTYEYDAFGNIIEKTGEANNNITYAGYQYDKETELYYLNARYYDSKIARFITEDTYRGKANDPLSLNVYTYCHNEPIMYTDPTEHWEKRDSNVSEEAQKQILEATNEYIEAEKRGDKEAMRKAHKKAEDARSGKVYVDDVSEEEAKENETYILSSEYVTDEAKQDFESSTLGSTSKDTNNVTSGPCRTSFTKASMCFFERLDEISTALMINDPIPNGCLPGAYVALTYVDNLGGVLGKAVSKCGKFVIRYGDDIIRHTKQFIKSAGRKIKQIVKWFGFLDDTAKYGDDVIRCADDLIEGTSKGNWINNKGYKPKSGERTLEGFMNNNVSIDKEIPLHTKSPGFNSNPRGTGGQFKRFGTDSHGGVKPHVHQPTRNHAPNGNIYGGTGSKTSNGGVTPPTNKDIKQLYDYLYNNKYRP